MCTSPTAERTTSSKTVKSGGNSVMLPGLNIHNSVEFSIPIRSLAFTSKNGHVQDMTIDQVHLGLPVKAGPFEGVSLAALRVLHASTPHNR